MQQRQHKQSCKCLLVTISCNDFFSLPVASIPIPGGRSLSFVKGVDQNSPYFSLGNLHPNKTSPLEGKEGENGRGN